MTGDHPRTDAELMREANRLACFVLDGQQRNYQAMRSLLRVLWCVLIATIGLLVALLAQVFR
jgi:hypothetical protein